MKRVNAPASLPEPLDTSDPAYATLDRIQGRRVDLVICGETGCGKDRLAQYLHERDTPDGPFIALNCAAVPEALAEAELFGHEAGAFTHAEQARAGKLEHAHGGTLYLDEIDSCPLWLQAKLLRALQERGAERLGSSVFRPSDFRLIASTKTPLEALVEQGRFRSDLYFRLGALQVQLTPLRCSPARVLKLFEAYMNDAAIRLELEQPPLTPLVARALLAHDWPGNIRELRAAATRHVLGLPLHADAEETAGKTEGEADDVSLRGILRAYERMLLASSLRGTEGSVRDAAEGLRMPLNTLYYRLNRLGLGNEC
ncbi:sigma 54-interacting transcriptional regulator [Aquabacterium sp. A7-Y]|uniref:sigma 54-interacting transcriptional regulator n=1 Tax=Aquabacterium sp. A7-Y TaxID=1349605 RepID=UPI00223DAC8B|nr:sigma 54-interacting transcriptional regulator [Aquabacterium sp. A7-Y]MCW7536970.1 sigma 54-interacting transcriptional regulator [Aquabacterium sp. A7-Y]